MAVGQTEREKPGLSVRNIGGIDETSVTFAPGVTVLAGQNATNRTSLLQALMAALGSENVSMKADADEATVELTVDGETHTQRFVRKNGIVRAEGEPYLDDATVADLFAFLLESNEARRAVSTGENLRDLIMRPIDTDEIQSEIQRLVTQRQQISDELDELDSLKGQLPGLEERRTALREKVEDTKEELESVEAELSEQDADVEQSREEKAELESRLSSLSTKRSELENIRYQLETEREGLKSLEREKKELEREAESLPDAPAGDLDDIDAEIRQLREQKRSLDSAINELQSIIRFNQEMLESAQDDVLDALSSENSGALTDQLLEGGEVTCWTCGTEVEAERIEGTVEQLRELSTEKLGEVSDLESSLESLKAERRELQTQQQRRDQIQRRLDGLERELTTTQDSIDSLTERRESVQAEIETVEDEVESVEDETYDEILELHREANQLEYDLGRLEGDLEGVNEEISSIESRLDDEDSLKVEREEVNDRIAELRTRIERIEQQAIEGFNEHMDTVLGLLEYDNIDRIWLERTEKQVREGRRKMTQSVFDLHIIRQTSSGTTYEDTVDHLSESERKVTGLVFALAGYLAHEVYETVPFMLLDSLEAIDADRIARLVEYLADHSEYLVVALLEQDAAALDDDYYRIETI